MHLYFLLHPLSIHLEAGLQVRMRTLFSKHRLHRLLLPLLLQDSGHFKASRKPTPFRPTWMFSLLQMRPTINYFILSILLPHVLTNISLLSFLKAVVILFLLLSLLVRFSLHCNSNEYAAKNLFGKISLTPSPQTHY